MSDLSNIVEPAPELPSDFEFITSKISKSYGPKANTQLSMFLEQMYYLESARSRGPSGSVILVLNMNDMERIDSDQFNLKYMII